MKLLKKVYTQKLSFKIILICLPLVCCNTNEIKDVKMIEGMWEIYSVKAKGETFYPKGTPPLIDYYIFNSDSSGTKKKMKQNFNNIFLSSLDEINFEIIEIEGFIYLDFISKYSNWREKVEKLTKNELIISNKIFEYHYRRFKKN